MNMQTLSADIYAQIMQMQKQHIEADAEAILNSTNLFPFFNLNNHI